MSSGQAPFVDGDSWDLAVVGSGIAGLTAALAAADRGARVVILTKAALADSATRWAQGGLAAVLPEAPGAGRHRDNVAAHVADTLSAGAGLSEESVARIVCAEGAAVMDGLRAAGAAFDHDESGHLIPGLEAAHSAPRIYHAAGDATGQAIAAALIDRVRRHDGIMVRERALVCDLLLGESSAGGGGQAVLGLQLLDGAVRADAVVLATGGAGQLYPRTTNPRGTTGDGVALAGRAGAVLADLEFMQFHPTALALPRAGSAGPAPLISEAVRGEGAVLRDAAGARFMIEAHPDAELAPRDVVARAIARRMRTTGSPVSLDATALGAEFLARRFPGIDTTIRRSGLDWSRVPVPIAPAAHYLMGGVATDTEGRSSLPGLFVVGEAGCTGLHGANRLASNSLLEGAVLGRRAAEALGAWSPWQSWPALPEWVAAGTHVSVPLGAPRWAERERTWERSGLQALMWQAAGLERTATRLDHAAETLARWAIPSPTTAAELEDANLLTLARAVVAAAAARDESRGAHWREDAPHTETIARHSIVRREEQ